jgi:hypothetical protein
LSYSRSDPAVVATVVEKKSEGAAVRASPRRRRWAMRRLESGWLRRPWARAATLLGVPIVATVLCLQPVKGGLGERCAIASVGAPYLLSARGVYADAASGTIVKSVQPEQLPLGERTTVIIDAEHLDQILSAELVPSTGVSVADVKRLEKAKRGGSRWSVAITVDRAAPTGDRRLVLVTPGGRAEWVLRIPSHVPMISRMSILTLESNPIAVNILFLVTDSVGDLSPQESLRVRIGFESSGGVLWREQPPDDTTLLAAGRLRVRKAVEFKGEGLSFSGRGQALLSVGFWDREGNRSAEYKVPVQFPGSKQVRQIPPADLVAGLSDAQLAERAENDIFSEVRRAAVSKLTDTRLLARIAKEDIVDYVRQAAIAQITDQAVLGEIARTSPHWQDRFDVVEKLGDSPLLWEIAKSDPNSAVRLFALKKVTNQITLYEAVKGDPVSGNREAALERIKDPAMLSVIATTNPEDRIRWIATRRVVDQDVLIRIAKTDPRSLVREEAAYRVSNQESLLEILRTETEENVRLAAAKRVTGQEQLARLAQSDRNDSIRRWAVSKLNDEKLCNTIALLDESNFVGEEAVKKVRAPAMLAEIALRAKSAEARRSAVNRISDETVLREVALKDLDEFVRMDAVRKISSPEVLGQVARKDASEIVSCAAVERIEDQTLLAEVAQGNPFVGARLTAVRKLDDRQLLRSLAATDQSPLVRNEAQLRLKTLGERK